MSSFTVQLCPPKYPSKQRPWTCRHEPQFVMQSAVRIVKRKSRNMIEMDHSVCLACGSPRPCTVGGNVLVDLSALWEHLGWHAEIGSRIIALRDRWSRIATHLFGPDGWYGRHEKRARLIDPNLTMKLNLQSVQGSSTIFAKISVDPEFFGEVDR